MAPQLPLSARTASPQTVGIFQSLPINCSPFFYCLQSSLSFEEKTFLYSIALQAHPFPSMNFLVTSLHIFSLTVFSAGSWNRLFLGVGCRGYPEKCCLLYNFCLWHLLGQHFLSEIRDKLINGWSEKPDQQFGASPMCSTKQHICCIKATLRSSWNIFKTSISSVKVAQVDWCQL